MDRTYFSVPRYIGCISEHDQFVVDARQRAGELNVDCAIAIRLLTDS